MNIIFEKMTNAHAKDVLDIFNYYIENSFAAYLSTKLPYDFFNKFLEIPNGFPSYVIKNEDTEKVVGFCFLRAYSPFPTFKETAEITYFIEKDSVGMGIGQLALNLLEEEAQKLDIKYLLANISSKNEQSLKFHAKNGFKECGSLHNIGKKKNENFDIVYMEKSLLKFNYAERISNLKASEVREMLKITETPEIISFAGGLPAPELFPVDAIKKVNRLVLEEDAESALQYSTTEGYEPLRKWCANRMNKRLGTNFDYENILITHGSQQALDLSGKVFLNKGDIVLCESPTYLAAVSAFKAYECDFKEVQTDDEGMVTSELENILKTTEKVKLIYVIPDFQNPTGRTWTLERRKALAELASKYNVIVIEDNPYGELRFEGETLPSVKSFDKSGHVLCLGSFSKIFCPGYRIGWISGDKEIIKKYVLVKQCTDLQCNTLAQREISKYLELYDIDKHIEKIREVYRERRNLAIETMGKEFPSEIKFTRPQGGLFMWVELPNEIIASDILEKCLKRNVAFVTGDSFFPNGERKNTFRLNFSNMPNDRIVKGLKCIGNVLKEYF